MEPTRVIKGSYRDAVRRARALERLGKGDNKQLHRYL